MLIFQGWLNTRHVQHYDIVVCQFRGLRCSSTTLLQYAYMLVHSRVKKVGVWGIEDVLYAAGLCSNDCLLT